MNILLKKKNSFHFTDTKPKLKNHYRAHRLSFWLNLIPDLHKPGNDDVPLSHHELENDDAVDTKSTVKPLSPQRDKLNSTFPNGTTYPATLLFNFTSLRGNRSVQSNSPKPKNQVPVQSIDHDLYDDSATTSPQTDRKSVV